MRYILIGGLLSGAALLGWLLAGRFLVTLLDRVTLSTVETRHIESFLYDDGMLDLGGTRVDLVTPTFARPAELSLQSDGRVLLQANGRRFSLGTGHALSPSPVGPQFECIRDAGDNVQFTIEHSRIAWPTPFEMNFMTGYSPSSKRSVYLRLHWTKRNGAQLNIRWQTGQSYYRRDGWSPTRIEAVVDGLIDVRIQESG